MNDYFWYQNANRAGGTSEPATPPGSRWEEEHSTGPWQIAPNGHLPGVTAPRMSESAPSTGGLYQTNPPEQSAPAAPQENGALFRVSFVGADQQWYSLKVGQ